MTKKLGADALIDVTKFYDNRRPYDLYWCPHCGYRVTERVRPVIGWCWGPCLEIYGEPIQLTFVRGIGKGAPMSEVLF